MKVKFDCECGSEVSDIVRGREQEADFRITCDDCDSLYVVTITKIQ